MKRFYKQILCLVFLSVLLLPNIPYSVTPVHAQETGTTPMTMQSCRENERRIRTGDINQRETFAIEVRCTALVNQYFNVERYQSCALAEYDRIVAANGRITQAEMDGAEQLCRTGQTSGGSNPSNNNGAAANNNSSASSNSGGNAAGGTRSGNTDSLIFTAKPQDQFVEPMEGLSTTPLKQYYVNPLLLVNDRQTAFRVLINFLLGLVGVVAILFLVIHGFRYAASRGEESQISQAKKGILYAIIGLIVVLAAYTIVATVLNFGAQPGSGTINAGIGISF